MGVLENTLKLKKFLYPYNRNMSKKTLIALCLNNYAKDIEEMWCDIETARDWLDEMTRKQLKHLLEMWSIE